jgi:hypothetical protein
MDVIEILGNVVFWGLMAGLFIACMAAPVALVIWLFDTTRPK